MFSKIFTSVKNVTLERKIVISYCHGYDTIMMFFPFEGYQEKIVRLLGEFVTC